MRPHCKWMATITKVADIIPTIRKAFKCASEGIPGPVFIEFPLDTIWPEAQINELTSNQDGEVYV